MSRQVLAACDLDRTLIWGAGALDLPGPDEAAPTLVCVEVYQGRPLSFLTSQAYDDVAALVVAGTLVPVTTRTVEQYRRVRLPGPPPRFAVCANGGRLLVDGVEDAGHSRHVTALVAACAPVDEVAAALLEATRGDPGVAKRRVAQDLFCYLVLDPAVDPAPIAAAATAVCAPRGWEVSVQGRKVYALPQVLTKRTALDRAVDRAGASSYVAAGDAHLDTGMLTGAAAALVPRGSVLDLAGWTAPRVTATRATGVLAGQEVAAWLRERTEAVGGTR